MNYKDKQADLKEYILSDFHDKKYKRYSLIDIYATDYYYYNDLRKKGMVREDAIIFFDKKKKEIQQNNEISVLAFRKLKYECILDDYIKEELKETKILPQADIIKNKEKQNCVLKTPIIHCCDDYCKLKYEGKRKVHRKNQTTEFWFPVYKCQKCKKAYTSLSNYEDLHKFKIGDEEYINILLDNDVVRYQNYMLIPVEMISKTSCRIYEKGKMKKCSLCRGKVFKRTIKEKDAKGNYKQYTVYLCEKCDVYFLKYSNYVKHSLYWQALNPEVVPVIKEKREKKKEERAKRKKEERAKRKMEKNKQMEMSEIKRNKNIKIIQDIQEKEKKRIEKLMRKYETEKESLYDNIDIEKDRLITVKDFVVRRNTFKCMHQKHKLENIEASIKVIDKNGIEHKEDVTAGYCKECSMFFIMESTYQKLRNKGVPICKVCDEKTYLHNCNFVNGMRLAQESILMQYGYSVSQSEDLSSTTRRKILSLLVDNDILTKSDIISYLDFFINQRKYQHKFEKAIEKWEDDREYIAEYKAGTYAEYGVKGIYRKY